MWDNCECELTNTTLRSCGILLVPIEDTHTRKCEHTPTILHWRTVEPDEATISIRTRMFMVT